jgi:hypothetical protein
MTALTLIAEKLANALRRYPCSCITVGQWPLFQADAKAHKPRTCGRCSAIEDLELYLSMQKEKR